MQEHTNPNMRTVAETFQKRSLHNRKPFRTKSQKVEARGNAYKGKDGAFHSTAPTSLHGAPRGQDHG